MPKVFIIIINFNTWPDTLECLASLEKIDYDNFEVVLVDNGSKGNFQFPISNFQRLKINLILNKENLGFAGGNNQGIKMTLEKNADYVLLLNNDTVVEPDFLSKLVEAAEQNQKCGIFGPAIYYYDKPSEIWFAGGKVNWLKTKGEHNFVIPAKAGIQNLFRYPELVSKSGFRLKAGMTENVNEVCSREVDYITGCCLLIKRQVIEKIGLLSEDYFLYYEDVDWCLRAKKVGYKCFLVPKAKIWHKQSRSAGEFSYPYIYYHSRNGLILGSRFGLKPIVYLISFWIILKQIVKIITGFRINWARPVMKGVWDFWRGRKGKLAGYY